MKTATLLATVSAATSVDSGIYDLGELKGYSIGVLISGSNVAGTLILKASATDGSTFVDIASSSQPITNSADHIYNISDAEYRYVKVGWTYSSGTGDITITIAAKEPYKAST